MAVKRYFAEIEIPENVEIFLDNFLVKVKGKKGEIFKKMINPRIEFKSEDNKVVIKGKDKLKPSKSDKMFINTYRAHIKNMISGVQDGYNAKLKICSGHFPMQVSVADNFVQIKNFLGEKVPRKTKIFEGVKVFVKGDVVEVEGLDKEKVGQMAASIEQTTRITNRDRRIFQDGVFIVEKPGNKK